MPATPVPPITLLNTALKATDAIRGINQRLRRHKHPPAQRDSVGRGFHGMREYSSKRRSRHPDVPAQIPGVPRISGIFLHQAHCYAQMGIRSLFILCDFSCPGPSLLEDR
jgi:hypothetical protein